MQNWTTSTEIAGNAIDGLMDPRKFDGPSAATPSVHANELFSKNSKEARALAFIKIFQSHEYGPEGVADFDSDQVATLAKKYPRGVPSMTQLIRSEDQKLDWPKLLANWPVNNLDVHGYAPLHYATAEGRLDLVEMLLTHGANVNARARSGATPLGLALAHRHLKVVSTLVQRGASATGALDHCGMTALQRAVSLRLPNVVRLLLNAAGADANEPDRFGMLAVHRAAAGHLVATLDVLITNGAARVNPRTRIPMTAEMTPLHLAYDDVATLRFLLENGANATATDAAGRSTRSLINYALNKFGESTDHLRKAALKSCWALIILHPSYKPLLESFRRRTDKLRRLRRLRENVERVTHSASSSTLAVTNSNMQLERQELPSGGWMASVLGSGGRTSAMELNRRKCLRCLWHGDAKGVQHIMYRRGLDVNAPLNAAGETALHLACGLGDEPVVRRLLRNLEADPWRLDGRGQTPLHTLAQRGFSVAVLNVLLETVGKPETTAYLGVNATATGLTAVDMAALSLARPSNNIPGGDASAAKLLFLTTLIGKLPSDQQQPVPSLSLHWAAQAADLTTIRHRLSQTGANPNAEDLCGMTPLHWAVRNHSLAAQDRVVQACAVLMSAGSKVNKRDRFGFTPLHRCRLPRVCAFLVENGADLEARTRLSNGPRLTAYDLAVRRMPLSTRLGFNRSHDDEHKMPWRTVQALEKSAAARYLLSSGPFLTDQAESCFRVYSSVITMRAAHEARRSKMEANLAEKDRFVGSLLLRVKAERHNVHVIREYLGLLHPEENAAVDDQNQLKPQPSVPVNLQQAVSISSGHQGQKGSESSQMQAVNASSSKSSVRSGNGKPIT